MWGPEGGPEGPEDRKTKKHWPSSVFVGDANSTRMTMSLDTPTFLLFLFRPPRPSFMHVHVEMCGHVTVVD